MEGRIVGLLEKGETEEVLVLLQNEPELRRTVVQDGRTLLQLALQYDNEQLATRLLDGLARVLLHADDCGWTILHQAASAGRIHILERLIQLGVPLESTTKAGAGALHYAASKGHLRAVELLLKAGARAEARDNRGETPIHRAAAQGHTAIVETLLAGAPSLVNARNQEGNTPLHLASEPSTRTCLLDCGADPQALNEEGLAAGSG